ncbi:choline transporter-like protein 1 [Zophobas morio]|uniref:choline transporter-like protein 1 n=1 Tax=Zophobas morio TaxID=2755281 RepID=UPI0030835D96
MIFLGKLLCGCGTKYVVRRGGTMGSSLSTVRPEELVDFRKLNTSIENVEVPARPENRTVTDKKGFVIFGIAILILIPFLVYTLVNADSRHLTHYSDNCGNFCGLKNPTIDGVPCSGQDFTLNRYVNEKRECVSQNQFENKLSVLQPTNDFWNEENQFRANSFDISKVFTTKNSIWWRYLLAIFFTIALGVITLVLLRFAPAPFVWGILIFSVLVLLAATGFLWILYFQKYAISLLPILVWTIFVVIILIIFIVIFKRVGLVIQLYKETTKVLAAMPLVVFFPIFTSFIQIVVFVAAIVTTFRMFFFRQLTKRDENMYKYELSAVAIFTIIFNIIVASWAMRFVAGIQYMTISGGVARWYFSKNKDQLDSPVWSSFKVTVRYHLGTIAFGSFLLTLFAVVKALLKMFFRNACCRFCMHFCCNNVDILLNFLSGNSYIQTAIHGQSFLRSAKRATKLLLANIGNIFAINCVGDFILAMIIMLITLLATAVSFALFMDVGPAGIQGTVTCFIINLVIVYIIFGTFQTIIDSLFICFCEDSVMNDGISRPYYMSRGLMEFIENAKKAQGQQLTH